MEADNERGVVSLGPARQRTVLAVLLTAPAAVVSVDELVDRVWGPALPQRAHPILHTYLSRLRGVFAAAGGPALTRRSRGYQLEVDPSAVDAHQFRALVVEARQAVDDEHAETLWHEALGLWRGAPFADLDNDWLRAVAQQWEAQRFAAALDRNDVSLRRGGHASLLHELVAATSTYPMDERLAGQLMLALYRCGRQTDALAHYRLLHRRLVEEFGSDPSPRLRELHERVLRQDPQLAAPQPVTVTSSPSAGAAGPAGATPAQLPADIPVFAGRTTALRQLDTLLDTSGDPPSTVVITAIGGSAGIGKTTLALHWAHRQRHRFPDGQLYVNLRGFNPAGQAMSPPQALRTLLELLQVPPQRIPTSVEAQSGLYRGRLAGRRMLVLLDNARDADQVRPLLPGTPTTMVLVTSRNQLAGLVATEGAQPIRLDVLDDADARALLTGRLGAGRVAAEPVAVTQIISACAGLPLALAIVAARAATLPEFRLAVFADELTDSHGRLDALTGPDAATDVRAVFSWSYQALSPAAARLFRLLGLHAGPDISRPAAASLAGLPMPQTRRLLAELAGAHLLTEHRPGRYAFHDLLRAYAAELSQTLDAEPERRAARHRILDHYVHTAVPTACVLSSYLKPIHLDPPQPGVAPETLNAFDDAQRWFLDEQPALLAAVAAAAANGDDIHAWQLVWALRDFLHRRGDWHAHLETLHAALAAAQRLADPDRQASAHRNLGVAYRSLGRAADSVAHFQQALDLYTTLGDKRGQAVVHAGLSITCENEGRYREGLDHTERAIELYTDLGDPVGRAVCLSNKGHFQGLLGDPEQTLVSCRQALGPLEEHDHRDGQAHAWDTIGDAHRQLGQHQQAISSYQRAVDLFRAINSRHPHADTLNRLAETYLTTGDTDAARNAWREALTLLDEIGHPDADDIRKRLES
ncbi:BTAD domain-containing putative transcriptional regulator [Phytohabitans sp. ZYX-F-186]|uniref:BTAD domain-containing putative transcriptional regulator n=1 Tax=Phytohabitans maris TaxID=3071409 RepID=A0ABU0ZWB6_9ACTN|nr:BTAD domain-containing putative transcriptional regulator [Phytohabitans sp. ZYX-F-186]MDQ7911091.1 BTAD domain-containing putative transcriptional regulator [Phytohabitans sp. ZYX-F-186]